MTKEQEEAIEIMKHWIDYEKNNRDKINKADELIGIQETVLSMLKENSAEIEKKNTELAEKNAEIERLNRQIDLMVEMIDELSEYYTRYWGKNNEFCKENCIKKDIDCKDCIKQYFEKLAKEEGE